MDQPREHAILAGKYRLIRQLGRGGMGSVWYTEHLTLRSPVAIKFIDARIAENPEALTRFLREARAAAALRSPHVVQILDQGVDGGVPFIAMEVLEGESLADRLEQVGRLTPADTARIVTHVARALSKAHEVGIIHRDLKPENIFLVRNDEEEIAKVLDFGIAKSMPTGLAMSASSQTDSGLLLGTPSYMSPEQAEGEREIDHRSDIWTLGVIAFECLVGGRPFDAVSLGSVFLAICAKPMPIPSRLGEVPPGFDEWFARACARDVEQRYTSAKVAAADLRRICEAVPSSTSAVALSPPSPAALAIVEPAAPSQRAVERSFAPVPVHDGESASRSKSKSPRRRIAVAAAGLIAVAAAAALRLRSSAESTSTQTMVAASIPAPEPPLEPEMREFTQESPAASLPSAPSPVSSAAAAAAAVSSKPTSPSTNRTRRPPAKKPVPAQPKVNFGF